MLFDITSITDGLDLGVSQSEAPRAKSVLETQFGELEYAPDFGTDLRFFLETELRIQPESFQAYCVQRLLQHQINVVNVLITISDFLSTTRFGIGSSESDGSLIG